MIIRRLYCVVLWTFLLSLPTVAKAQSARAVNPLATYPQRYATINRELPGYRTIAVDMDALGTDRRSTDGGKVEASCKGSETRRIVAIDYGEHGSSTTNFYFWNNSLFFVQILSQRSDELYGAAVESSDDRLYYLDGKLVKWLDVKNAPQPINTSEARQTDRSVKKDAALFFARLNGCPSRLLVAADADTAAPVMAPVATAYDTGMRVSAAPAAPRSVRTRLQDVRERGYIAAMKSDLRNLATYEEQYAADNQGYYFSGKASLSTPLHGFTPSTDVTIHVTATRGSPPNWSATATHARSSAMCAVQDGVTNCQ